LQPSTFTALSKLTHRSEVELRQLWEKDTPTEFWNPDPIANNEIARLVANKIRGKYPNLKTAAKAIEINQNTLRRIFYQSELIYIRDSLTQKLATLLNMTTTQIRVLIKATSAPPMSPIGESQPDVPAVACPDAAQLTLADA